MPGSQRSEQEESQSVWQPYPFDDATLESRSWVQPCAYAVLLFCGAVALFALVRDVSGYIRSIESARGLSLEIANLEFTDDDNPRITIRFDVRNDSPLDMKIERFGFSLYLNGERVGSNYSTYLGTDPEVDPEAYRQARYVSRVVESGESIDLEFTIYIYSAQMDIVRRAQQAGVMSWYAMAEARTLLPYSWDETRLRLQAGFEE
jgi:hypothetical protein